jgi:general nucleoside transport system permease protein
MIHLLSSADLWFRTVQASTALLLVALGGYLILRSGIFHLGLEGTMLIGAFCAAVAAERTAQPWVGIPAGALAGLVVTVLFAALVVTWRANQLMVGLAINFLALGATSLALQLLYHVQGGLSSPRLASIPTPSIPGLAQLPWVGDVLSGQTVLTYASWLLAAGLAWWIVATRGGLTLRVVGLRPEIAAALGRSVTRTQWLALAAGGVLIGLGGAQLALGEVAEFQEGMTSGRGFVALLLVLIAGRYAWLLAPLALGFALFDALGFSLQTVGLPDELSSVMPYLAVMLFLGLPSLLRRVRRRATAPLERACATEAMS